MGQQHKQETTNQEEMNKNEWLADNRCKAET